MSEREKHPRDALPPFRGITFTGVNSAPVVKIPMFALFPTRMQLNDRSLTSTFPVFVTTNLVANVCELSRLWPDVMDTIG